LELAETTLLRAVESVVVDFSLVGREPNRRLGEAWAPKAARGDILIDIKLKVYVRWWSIVRLEDTGGLGWESQV
jgi:hypothetical protein